MKQQRIVCAAIRFGDGAIICCARHYDMVMHGVIQRLMSTVTPSEQGFIDNNGLFHNRETAFRIATAADQIRHKSGNPNSNELFSEDLY